VAAAPRRPDHRTPGSPARGHSPPSTTYVCARIPLEVGPALDAQLGGADHEFPGHAVQSTPRHIFVDRSRVRTRHHGRSHRYRGADRRAQTGHHCEGSENVPDRRPDLFRGPVLHGVTSIRGVDEHRTAAPPQDRTECRAPEKFEPRIGSVLRRAVTTRRPADRSVATALRTAHFVPPGDQVFSTDATSNPDDGSHRAGRPPGWM